MNRIGWIALRAAQTLIRRYLHVRDPWAWHHHKMSTNPPYAQILIQGIVKALWQETFEEFLRVLGTTIAEVGGHLKYGARSID